MNQNSFETRVVRIFNLLSENKKNEEDALIFSEDVINKLDNDPCDGKISKGNFNNDFAKTN